MCPEAMVRYFVLFQRLMLRNPIEATVEEEVAVECPYAQAMYRPNGYELVQFFKISFDADARPAYVSLRISPQRKTNTIVK